MSIYVKIVNFSKLFCFLFFWRIHFVCGDIFAYLKFAERTPFLIPSSIYFCSSPFLLFTPSPLVRFLHPFCHTVWYSMWGNLTVINPRSSYTILDISLSNFKFICSIVPPKQSRGSHLLYLLSDTFLFIRETDSILRLLFTLNKVWGYYSWEGEVGVGGIAEETRKLEVIFGSEISNGSWKMFSMLNT